MDTRIEKLSVIFDRDYFDIEIWKTRWGNLLRQFGA